METGKIPLRAFAAVGVAAVALGGLWALDPLLLRIPVLTPLGDQGALSPLYAFFQPTFRGSSWLFVVFSAVLVWLAPRLTDPEKCPSRSFAWTLATGAVVGAVALFVVRAPIADLGRNLAIYPGEEIYFDALKIGDLAAFWRDYVEIIPELGLHGQHFPPGLATLLYVIRVLFGPGLFPVAVAVVGLFGLGMAAAFRAALTLLDEVRARQAVLLLLAVPSLLDFACTANDAVFFAAAALALWLSLEALSSRSEMRAFLAGASLGLATLVSYSALPLGLAVALYGLLRARTTGRTTLWQLGWIGVGYASLGCYVYAATGFDPVAHFLVAHARAAGLMTSVVGGPLGELFLPLAYGNFAAFAIGGGVALAGALILTRPGPAALLAPFPLAALLTLAVLVLGGLHQMETERIWLFVYPWLAVTALWSRPVSPGALRVLLAAGVAQALAMESALFTLW